MKNNLKISVIMAVYNCEKYLDESIQSILSQSFKNFEFIIINDCSTDNSLNIIKKYAKEDNRIILINNKKNLGRPEARNKGLKISKGKYIAILDSDDISLSKRLEKQYNFLEKNKDIFLIVGGAEIIDLEGRTIKVVRPLTQKKEILRRLSKKSCIFHSSIMFRNEYKFFYRKKFVYAQDYDFYLLLITAGKRIGSLDDIVIKYRVHPKSLSFSKAAKQKLFANKANFFYLERIKNGKDSYSKFKPQKILELDVEKSLNRVVLTSQIKMYFNLYNYKKTKLLARKYFEEYGYFNKVLFYFASTFLGKHIMKILIRLMPIKILRSLNN